MTATKQVTLSSIDSNHNILWLDSEDLIENLFATELVKLCSSQDLIICNGVMKWPNSPNNLQWSNEVAKLQPDDLYSWARQ
jgi:hypothetical protein